jgi:L-amino acid N-acyltransferase YncA
MRRMDVRDHDTPYTRRMEASVGLATRADLDAILTLQRANLESALDSREVADQGFVTVAHTREVLERMHSRAPSVVARSGGEVVGYAIAMSVACRDLVPILVPMFSKFEELAAGGRPLRESRFYVCGQVCVARSHRGTGLFDALYRGHAEAYGPTHDWIVTQISTRNPRSIRAHARVGFHEISHYRDSHDDWSVVAWDFR